MSKVIAIHTSNNTNMCSMYNRMFKWSCTWYVGKSIVLFISHCFSLCKEIILGRTSLLKVCM